MALGAILVAFAVLKLATQGPNHRRTALLLVLYTAIPVLAIWWLSQSRPVFKDRYLISSLAPYQILMACALVPAPVKSSRRWWGSIRGLQIALGTVLAIVLSAGILSGTVNYMAPEIAARSIYVGMYETFVKYSAAFAPEQVRWAVIYPDYAFTCYLRTPNYLVMPYRANDPTAADAQVRDMHDAGVRRVLLQIVNDTYWNGPDIAVRALSKEFTQIGEGFTGHWPVKIFSRIDSSQLQPVDVSFSNTVTLVAARIYPDIQGRLLEVHLLWNGEKQVLTGGEKLFMHVTRENAPDQLVTQLDMPFTADDLSGGVRTFGVPLPNAMPGGPYQVLVGLYNANLSGMPRLTTTAGLDHVDIGHFTVPAAGQRRR